MPNKPYQFVELSGKIGEHNGCCGHTQTPIRDFYQDKIVLLTGGTGFLGQLFVEKLLRTGVKEIYILTRSKKGKSSHERLGEIFSGTIFQKLAKFNPNYMQRIRVIEGNLIELNAGITEADEKLIIDNVQIVVHSAADVRFDETLQHLIMCNIRGTREILTLATKINQLQVFLHISTAYSHCTRSHIGEEFYQSPYEPDQIIDLIEKLNPDNAQLMEIITERLTSPWPNTYTFTKAITERLVQEYGLRIPLAIIRPSIIIATHEDPVAGWINNVYGLTGVLVSVGLGFQRVLPYKPDKVGDIVCADFVVNSVLAVGWATVCDRKKYDCKVDQMAPIPDTKIYNVTNDQKKSLTYGRIAEQVEIAFYTEPAVSSLWLPTGNTTNYAFLELIYMILYHIIPGLWFDIYFMISGSNVRLMPMYRKCHKFMTASKYFMQREWTFDNKRMIAIYDRMTSADKAFFPSDVRNFQFNEYCTTYVRGMRKYIGKEDVDSSQHLAKAKLLKLKILHGIVLVFYYTFIVFALYFVMKYFGWINLIKRNVPFRVQVIY